MYFAFPYQKIKPKKPNLLTCSTLISNVAHGPRISFKSTFLVQWCLMGADIVSHKPVCCGTYVFYWYMLDALTYLNCLKF